MTESLKKKLAELASPGVSGSDTRATQTPENWRPRSEVDQQGGFAISSPRPLGNTPGAEDIMLEHGLNPQEWVVTNARHGKWQTFNGDWLESSRITLAPAQHIAQADFDLEKLVDDIKSWKPSKSSSAISGDSSFVFAPSDQQIGKKSGENGTQQSIDRLLLATERGVHKLQALRKMGLSVGTVVIALPGDHVEGNVSQAGRLQGLASSDLGQTEQVRVARRLLMAQIKAFIPFAERIIVPVINGNHDEVTRQVAADPADGWNVEIASAVEDACKESDKLSHVEFRYPASGHQTLAIDINGVMLGLFHGHQFSRDVEKYLSGQMLGQTALGGADVWISGHYHHFKSQEIGERFWVQCPTTDPGSDWFRDRAGRASRPGVLSMVIGRDLDPREFVGVIPVD